MGCTWHNPGHALRRVSPNPLEKPLEVIITIVIVTPRVWMPSTSLGDIQGCAAGKQAQAVWLFSQSFNLMLCCPLCSLPAFQASNQCSSRLGRRDEPGPRMFHNFDDVALLALSLAVLQPSHLPGPQRVDRPSRCAGSSIPAGSWAVRLVEASSLLGHVQIHKAVA